MRILVADSDVRARAALHMLLMEETDQALIAESADLDSLAMQIRDFKPDLVLLDWELPGRAAAAILFALTGLIVRPKVIVLSRLPEARSPALAVGANAFVYKGDPPEDLLLACRVALGTASTIERP